MALTKISTDGVKDDAITKAKIPADQIEASELASSAVTNVKIAAGNVDNTAIGNNQVSLNKLVQGTSSNDGKFLRANNGADPSFETVSIPAGTTINNNADNRVITGSGTANTLEGEQYLTWNGSTLGVQKSGSGDAAVNIEVGNGISQSRLLFSDNSAVDGTVTYDHNARKLHLGAGTSSPTDGDIIIDSSGNVGIGTTSPTDKLDLNGTANLRSNTYIGGNLYMYGNSYGDGIFLGGSTSPNLLNDYEEGTYQPTFTSSGATFAYNHQYGYYTRIGDIIHVTFYITLSGTNSSGLSGNSIVINLPFAIKSSLTRFEAAASFGMLYKINLAGFGNPVGKLYQGNSFINLLYADDNDTGGAYGSDRFNASGCGISGSATYKA